MADFNSGDLNHLYSWSADGGDNPKLKGEPDSSFLDRTEGYEVLYMVRKLMDAWGLTTIRQGQEIERLIHAAPHKLRSQEKIKNWIDENRNRY